MAVKTFTTGEILTASNTNTYLANAGLVYVTSVTVGNAVSSVTVSNCFTATYDSYKILYVNGSASTTSNSINFNFNGAPAAWYGNLIYANFAAGAPLSAGYNNTTGINHGGCISSGTPSVCLEVLNPYNAKPSFVQGLYVDGSNAGTVTASNANSTSYTGFVLTPASGTLTGGVITVYGYRNA